MPIDLFTPVVPEEKWHPNFAAEMRRPNQWNRAVLNDWATGFIDRDRKFVQEFQTTFNSCFWELYLNAALRNVGCAIDAGVESPDFVISKPQAFVVEAAIASSAMGSAPEYASAELPNDLNEFNRLSILRLSNALHGKHTKYKTHYAKLPHVAGKPFVVALAPFDQPNPHLSAQRAIQALLYNYYVDEEKWIADGVHTPAPKSSLLSVAKTSDVDIELGVFVNGSMPELSAVIFSSTATWGKVRALSSDPNPNIFFKALRLNPASSNPHCIAAKKSEYTETLLDGLCVFHNPEAIHPLDPAVFRNPDVMQSYYSEEAGDWEYEQREGQLLFRQLITFVEKDEGPNGPS